ncbi:hypothetical protein [Kitasatospora sp. NPDC056531]|uniref:hypothetical protein n=1 Tax=Kitasatospora sp. NPDC056531 TaxID=3345856 RepID=UPI0036BC9C89
MRRVTLAVGGGTRLPGGVLAINVCRTRDGAPPSPRMVCNLILEAHLATLG